MLMAILKFLKKDYRSLLLTIIYETNRTELIQLNKSIIQSGQQLIDYVEKHFFQEVTLQLKNNLFY